MRAFHARGDLVIEMTGMAALFVVKYKKDIVGIYLLNGNRYNSMEKRRRHVKSTPEKMLKYENCQTSMKPLKAVITKNIATPVPDS